MSHKIFVTTSPKYVELLKVWLYTCNKYWQPVPEIVVLGNGPCTIDLPDNASFVNVGDDPDKNLWAHNMGAYFASIDDEYIAMIMEDCWIASTVDTVEYSRILEETQRLSLDRAYFTRSFKDLPKIRMHCRDAQETWGVSSNILYAKDPNANYLISLHGSFWKRTKLVELCSRSKTPWDMEEQGTVWARNTGWRTGIPIGSRAVDSVGVTLKYRDPGGPDYLNLDIVPSMPRDILIELKANGLLDHWINKGSADIDLDAL